MANYNGDKSVGQPPLPAIQALMQLITKLISMARSIPKRIGNDLQSQRASKRVLKRRGKRVRQKKERPVKEGKKRVASNSLEKSVLI